MPNAALTHPNWSASPLSSPETRSGRSEKAGAKGTDEVVKKAGEKSYRLTIAFYPMHPDA